MEKTVTSHASEAFTCRQAFGLYEIIFLPGIREAGYVTPHRVSHSGNWSIWRLSALVKVQQFRSGLLALWVQGILEKYCMLHSRNVAGGFTPTGISKGSIPFLFCFPCPYPPPPVLPSPHLLLFSSSPHQISFFFFPFWCYRLNPETCMCSTTVLHSSHQCHEFALKKVYYMMGGESDPI